MRLFSWLRNWKQADPAECRPHRSACRPATFRPRLELLEDRTLPSSYTAGTTSALIADINVANRAGGTNTITLASNTTFNLTAVNNPTDGANGLPVISSNKGGDNLTIIGNGDTIARSTAAGTPAFRLFDVATGNSLTLQNVTLQNGLAQGSGTAMEGGALLNSGTLTVSGSTLSGNVAADQGGGISNGGTATINGGSILSNNSATLGGGISNGGTLTVSSSTLSNNTAHGGGGILNGGTLTVTGSTLSWNVASTGVGGGIANLGPLTVSGSTLSNNSAGGNGGGISNVASVTMTVSGSSLLGNSAGRAGGGIYNDAGTVTVSSSSLLGNSAEDGGGIWSQGKTVTINGGSTLSGNTARFDYGGGIYMYSGTLTISGSTVGGTLPSNSAAKAGGGIFINSHATVTVKNSSSITGNTSPAGFGADVYNLGVLYLDSTSTIGILDGPGTVKRI